MDKNTMFGTVGVDVARSHPTKHHPLPPLQTSSSDLTQSSFADATDTAADLTPSTASSIYSANGSLSQPQSQSQSHSQSPSKMPIPAQTELEMPVDVSESTPLESVEPRDGPLHHDACVASTPPRSPSTASMMLDTPIQKSQGQKRTASGAVKSFKSPMGQHHGSGAGRHSRTSSTDSGMDRIAEVSAQLRTKLSYAAARVESRRQLQQSPASKRGSIQHADTPESPAYGSFGSKQLPRDSSKERENRMPFPKNVVTEINDHNHSLMANDQGSSYQQKPAVKLDMAQIPRLAPPADIVAGNANAQRRRPNPNAAIQGKDVNNPGFKSAHTSHQKPSLSHQSSSSSGHGNFRIPDTPPIRSQQSLSQQTPAENTLPKQRTPSQNALMEQDAIETLLFMSSPENSGYRTNSQRASQRSDLPSTSLAAVSAMGTGQHQGQPNSQYLANGRRRRTVSFADEDGRQPIVDRAPPTRPYQGLNGVNNGPEQHAGDDIDRMLDEMQDSDSDMDEEWLLKAPHLRQQQQQQQRSSQQTEPFSSQERGDGSSSMAAPSSQSSMQWA